MERIGIRRCDYPVIDGYSRKQLNSEINATKFSDYFQID
jgi:hypothetical protein